MSRLENPPFERGKTFYDGATIDSANLGGTDLEGVEWEFDDLDYSIQGVRPKRTNRKVLCRVIRNVSTAVLLPSRLAKLALASGIFGNRAIGMTSILGENCFAIDEWLPAAGCPINDLCWVVVRGAALLTTAATGFLTVAIGDRLNAATAAASTGGTATGKVQGQAFGATAPLEDEITNMVGRALSARTTNETNSSILVDIGRW